MFRGVGIIARPQLRIGLALKRNMTMRNFKTLVLAGAVFAGATAVASAADLGPPPMHGGLPPAPLSAPIAEVSGWYLRGDIGVAHQTFNPQLEDRRFVPTIVKTFDFDASKVPFAGVGVGYQVNSWLRADITAERRFQQNFRFEDKSCYNFAAGSPSFSVVGAPCSAAQLALPAVINNRNYYNGRLVSNVFLANGYLDLGNWNGFSPFVGAGAGFASHTFSKVTDVGAADRYLAGVYQNTTSSNLVSFSDASKTNFAWALMAGVGYDVSPTTKLEFGYRYLNMGTVKQNVLNCTGGPGVAGSCGDNLHYKHIQSHEFKLGMRWMLGGTSYAAAPVHAAPMAYPAEPRMIKKF
jgi:opacity protein-like surface antigen